MSYPKKPIDSISLMPSNLNGEALVADGNAALAPGRATGSVGSLTSAGVERVLHYDVQTKLGEGGMGVVYRALDQKLNRLVALKFLPPQIDRSDADLQRFLQEANALSALNHPHIATIYAVETTGEQHFLVLEYLPGGTLKAKLQQTYSSGAVLSIEDVLKYARQTAEGLAHAHARGIVHRDVKTSNLMLTKEGDVKITDFGVAKLSGSSLATVPGSLMGTIAYMSPEQVLGMGVDTRSDVFSFGVLLFELLAGRLPFEAPNDAALITKVASARAPELKVFRHDVPDELELVVQTALKKRVEERYQRMEDLLTDLQAPTPRNLLRTQTRLRTIRTAVGSPPSRRLRVVAASVLLFAALLAGALFWILGRHKLPVERQLVVIPVNLTGDQSNEALFDGFTELIANKLSQLEQFQGSLSVVAPSEVRDQNVKNARAARKELGATLVLETTVQQVRDHVFVTLNLRDTAKQTILDARDVQAPIEPIEKLRELPGLLVGKVAEMLKVQVKPEALVASAADKVPDPRAYALYLQGRGYLQRYDRVEDLDKAIDLFQLALSRDPSYALAYAGKAEAYLREYQAKKEPLSLRRAEENGQRAIEFGNTLAPAHHAMGLVHAVLGHYELAVERFQKSIDIQPNPDAYRELANAYDKLNRIDDAEENYRTAIQMHPRYWAGYRDLGIFYQNHGRFEEALPLLFEVIELTPDNYRGYANLGGLYLRLGLYADAIKYTKRAIDMTPTWASYHNLGTAYYHQEKYEDAIKMFLKAIDLAPTESTPWAGLADAYRYVPQPPELVTNVYRQAIELTELELTVNPRNAQKRATLASLLAPTDGARALQEIEKALLLDPKDNFVHARAALVYEQRRLREKALAAVKSAIELGFPVGEIEHWPPLVRLVQDPRYAQIIEAKKSKKSATVPTGNK